MLYSDEGHGGENPMVMAPTIHSIPSRLEKSACCRKGESRSDARFAVMMIEPGGLWEKQYYFHYTPLFSNIYLHS